MNQYASTLEYWRIAAADVNFESLAKNPRHIATRLDETKLPYFLPWPTSETKAKWLESENARAHGDVPPRRNTNPVAMLIAVTDHRSALRNKVVLAIPLAHSENLRSFVPVRSGQAPLINPLVLSRPDSRKSDNDHELLAGNDKGIYLAEEQEYQAYVLQHDVSTLDTWPDYWRYAQAMIKTLTGYCDVSEGIGRSLGCDLHWMIVTWQPDAGAFTLGSLYKDLSSRDNVPLFRRVAQTGSHVPTRFGINEALPGFSAMVGHMDTFDMATGRRQGFPLDRSQRMAAAALTQTNEGQVLAVNGPPGTGKTSFLRSVVATAFVEAALQGRQAPIILSTGTTNKAVVNVIEAFLSVPEPFATPQWTSRWINHAPSYGWFFPSKSKLKEPKFQKHMMLISTKRGSQTFFEMKGASTELIGDEDSLKADILNFLGLHADCFGMDVPLKDIGKAVDHLRGQLIASVNAMRDLQSKYLQWLRRQGGESDRAWQASGLTLLDQFVAKGYPATSPAQWLSDAQSNPFDQIIEVEACLDQTYRFFHFHMACRYWEARWLLQQQMRGGSPCQHAEQELRELAMLAPVFVCTTLMLPRLLPQFNHADVLVFDEAGQTSVEAGAAMFAFAKKAIVLGDVHQLKPVYRISPARDRDISRQIGLKDLPDQLRVASSSVMRMAQAVTQWTDVNAEVQGNPGINLMQHYRCRPAIIGYCQQIIYGSGLKPCRKDPADAPLPAMGWVSVKDHQGESRESGSRLNWDEIDQITKWLSDVAPKLLEHYGETSLAKVVAIISPFSAQVAQIKLAVQAALPPELVKDMIIDTVHALQGAEIPVVAFSLAQTEGPYFVEREGPNLLNVAVSRAKDSFIAFASERVWQDLDGPGSEETPMRLLHRYMRRHGQRAYPRECYLIEAPGKVEAIANALGVNARVLPTVGHFKKLVMGPGKLAFETTSDFVVDMLASIVREHRHYDHIYLATDDDDDGEEIAWHLKCELSRLGLPATTKLSRMRFHAVTRSALIQARQDAQPDVDLVRVQTNIAKKIVDQKLHERMRADRLEATRPQWLVLKELARRHESFPKWAIAWSGQCEGLAVSGWIERGTGEKVYWPTRDRVDDACRRLGTNLGHGQWISKVSKRKLQGPPTTTAHVLALACLQFGWKPKKTMNELRVLYEGRRRLRVVGAKSCGHMQSLTHGGVISYPRTEGTSLLYPTGDGNAPMVGQASDGSKEAAA